MEIFRTLRESDNISVFWENKGENERQIFVLKIDLETIAYTLEKVSNLPPCCFVCLSLSEFYGHAMLIGNIHTRKEQDVYLLQFARHN